MARRDRERLQFRLPTEDVSQARLSPRKLKPSEQEAKNHRRSLNLCAETRFGSCPIQAFRVKWYRWSAPGGVLELLCRAELVTSAALPDSIDVEKFVEVRTKCTRFSVRVLKCLPQARSFEITAMQEAMKNAKYADLFSVRVIFFDFPLGRSGSTHRAWQELPRHLRRRAASHRVRRVPLRLRNKSRSEVRSGSPYICVIL
jgi:hypothetical protein